MKRVMLVVAYDGTNYSGWQLQPGVKTIEGELNRCLSEFLHEDIKVIGASRTDAGVHALGNLAVFDTDAKMPGEKFSYALNQTLPRDIKIQKSMEVDWDFHPRKVNTRKTYEYKIYNAQFPNPVYRLYHHFTYIKLDIDKMKEAAKYFVGEHDFFSFSTFKPEIQSTVRTIYSFEVDEEKIGENAKEIVFRVTGNGFLYNMVRILAGTLIEVGRGRINPEEIPEIMEKRNRDLAGPTAPPQGLVLKQYEIEKES